MHPEPAAPSSPGCRANRVVLLCGLRPLTEGTPETPASAAEALAARLIAKSDLPWKALAPDEARSHLHADLMPVVDQLLHGGPRAAGPAYVGRAPLVLQAPKWLRQQGYALRLSAAAQRRLAAAGVSPAAAQRLGVVPEGATLYTMASGLVMLAFSLRVTCWDGQGDERVPYALFEEAVYTLGHAADRGLNLHAVRVASPRPKQAALPAGTVVVPDPQAGHALVPAAPEPVEGGPKALPLHLDVEAGAPHAILLRTEPEPLSMEQLVGRLLGLPEAAWSGDAAEARAAGSSWLAAGGGPHGRRFLMCSALLDDSVPDAQLPRMAYALAHRYGADYRVRAADVSHGTIQPFENVCHAMATQGAAILVRDTGASFIRQFIDSALPATYLPLALLSYHEYLHLLHLTQECAFMPDVAHPEHDTERLMRLRSELAAFRLYFRFSHVSDLSHHNRVHRTWREALDLDRMLQEVTLDVREAEQVLARIHEESEERRHAFWRKLGVGGVVLGSVVGLLHLAEAAMGYLFADRKLLLMAVQSFKADPAATKALAEFVEHAHHLESALLLAAVLLGVLGGILLHKAGAKGGGH